MAQLPQPPQPILIGRAHPIMKQLTPNKQLPEVALGPHSYTSASSLIQTPAGYGAVRHPLHGIPKKKSNPITNNSRSKLLLLADQELIQPSTKTSSNVKLNQSSSSEREKSVPLFPSIKKNKFTPSPSSSSFEFVSVNAKQSSSSSSSLPTGLSGFSVVGSRAGPVGPHIGRVPHRFAKPPPISKLAGIEIQLIMQYLDMNSLMRLAYCNRRLLADARSDFAWKYLPPRHILCSESSADGSTIEPTLLRHIPGIAVEWTTNATEPDATLSLRQSPLKLSNLWTFKKIVELHIYHSYQLNLEDWTELCTHPTALKRLDTLVIGNTKSTQRVPPGVVSLWTYFPCLTNITIWNGFLDEVYHLDDLASLPLLTKLTIIDTERVILPQMWVSIGECASLTALEIVHSDPLPDIEFMKALKSMPLKSLYLSAVDSGFVRVDGLRDLTQLNTLILVQPMGVPDFNCCLDCQNLTMLDLYDPPFADGMFARFFASTTVARLEQLTLRCMAYDTYADSITDEQIVTAFSGLKYLKQLSLIEGHQRQWSLFPHLHLIPTLIDLILQFTPTQTVFPSIPETRRILEKQPHYDFVVTWWHPKELVKKMKRIKSSIALAKGKSWDKLRIDVLPEERLW